MSEIAEVLGLRLLQGFVAGEVAGIRSAVDEIDRLGPDGYYWASTTIYLQRHLLLRTMPSNQIHRLTSMVDEVGAIIDSLVPVSKRTDTRQAFQHRFLPTAFGALALAGEEQPFLQGDVESDLWSQAAVAAWAASLDPDIRVAVDTRLSECITYLERPDRRRILPPALSPVHARGVALLSKLTETAFVPEAAHDGVDEIRWGMSYHKVWTRMMLAACDIGAIPGAEYQARRLHDQIVAAWDLR